LPPLVLVHGNPETSAVWDHLVPSLTATGRDPVLLSPPGFGAPIPTGFAATPDGYRDWLARELEALGRPADVLGHDWGGGFVVLLAMHRPDLVRTWASDALGVCHPDYVWHDRAQIWQTQPAGEEWIAQTLAAGTETWTQTLISRGVAEPTAQTIAPAFDAEMGRCILELYRAAAQPWLADTGRRLPAARQRPGLGIVAQADRNAGTPAQRREMIASAGAETVELPDAGHWWMTAGDQSVIVDALRELWNSAEVGTSALRVSSSR
jgi:pimeloyl-ACP methyl ester carboxylesterase